MEENVRRVSPGRIASSGFWFGAALLVVGVLMVLDRWNMFSVSIDTVFAPILVVAGAFLVMRAFAAPRNDEHAKVIVGTILFLTGVLLALSHFDVITTPSGKGIGTVMIILGLSFAMDFVYDTSTKKLLLVAILLMMVGALGVFGVVSFSLWRVGSLLWRWWPVLIILSGIMMFVRRRGR